MITDSELYKLLDMDRGTLYRWRGLEDTSDPKYRIYRILKRLPKEFIEETIKSIEEEQKLKNNTSSDTKQAD
jgi:hypothetical protein